MVTFIKNIFKNSKNNHLDFRYIQKEMNDQRFIFGQVLSHQFSKSKNIASLLDVEFKVYSQFGDDGIIQFLVNNLPITHKSFIEFGVENYTEANTRFLLMNNNWKGLVMDADATNIEHIQNAEIYWKYNLNAVESFVTKENINNLFLQNDFNNEIGLLSIDIDGNDYWIWEAINVVNPVIVIVEYNSLFGDEYPISIPYKENFSRTNAHFSNLYWGCSLGALNYLAEKKGYVLIGCNSAGNNAYFVRKDHAQGLPNPSLKDAYVISRFRESRNQKGELTFLSGIARVEAIKECRVVDVISQKEYRIKELPLNKNK